MNLASSDLTRLAELAIKAATQAGKFISETRPVSVQRKAVGDSLASSVVTEVDEQSQELILQILEPSFAQYDLALLTEEREDDRGRLEKDFFWCIDPIDGTLPFIEGVPGYAVSIALVSRDGVPHIGVVYDPVEHTLYHAIRGQGAFRNSAPWQLAPPSEGVSIITDRSIAELPYCAEIAAELSATVKSQGGAAMNAMWCLENAPACYFKFPKAAHGGGCFWDYAATACIYNEIGAVATATDGSPLNLNRPDSVYMNHCGILYSTDFELAKRIRCAAYSFPEGWVR